MKKSFILFIFLFILYINFVSASTLSVLPNQINFYGKPGEILCQEVTIKTSDLKVLEVEDKWAEKGETKRILSLHGLESEEVGINMNYIKEFPIENSKKIKICLNAKKSGDYHGALLFRIQGEPIRVGIWIMVKIQGNDVLTFNKTKLPSTLEKPKNKTLIFSITGILIIFLFALLFLKNKK